MTAHCGSVRSKVFTFAIVLALAVLVLVTPNSAADTRADDELGSFGPVWWGAFGAGLEDDGLACLALDNGGAVVAGLTESYGAGSSDLWMLRTDADGAEVWNSTFGGKDYDFGTDVMPTADGGFVVLGTTASAGAGMMDAWLIRTDENGTELWSKTYGGEGDDKANGIAATSDGGYIITGHTNSVTDGWSNVWVLKLNASGGQEWTADFGGEANDEGEAVIQTSDGGYVVVGTTKAFGAGKSDLWVIGLNASGGHVWNRTFGGVHDELANTVIELSDGNLLVSAQTRSFGATDEDFFGIRTDDIWLIKLDTTGKEIWNTTIGGLWYEYGDALLENPDGTIMVAGSSGTFQGEIFNIVLFKCHPNGSVQWYKSHGGKDYEFANDLAVTPDGNYLVVGSTMSFGAGATDMLLMEFDPLPPAPVINQPPTLAITSPADNTTVSGMLKIEGTAADDGYYMLIMVKFDNGTWVSVSEDKSWFFFWNTTKVTDGMHTIYAQVTDGALYSEEARVNVITDNGNVPDDGTPDDEDEEEEEPFLFAGLGVVLLIVILFVIIAVQRRKQRKQ